MSISGIYSSGKHSRNLGHFASIVKMATADGKLGSEEEKLLHRFAKKLNISETEYDAVLSNPSEYPMIPPNAAERRLERLHDLFQIVFADNTIDENERQLIERYAIGLGYTEAQAHQLIERSVEIYSGGLSFDDYRYLVNRERQV